MKQIVLLLVLIGCSTLPKSGQCIKRLNSDYGSLVLKLDTGLNEIAFPLVYPNIGQLYGNPIYADYNDVTSYRRINCPKLNIDAKYVDYYYQLDILDIIIEAVRENNKN